MCNPDVRPKGDALGAVEQCFSRHRHAALVGVRMYDEEGRLRASVADIPRLRDAVRGRYWWNSWPHDEERTVGQVTEACYVVRRSAVEAVGGADPGYFLYWEGADWARRFAEGGWETWFCPGAEVVHTGGATTGRRRWRRIVWSHRGAYRFFKLHSRVPAPLLAVVFGTRAIVKLALEAVVGTDSQIPLVDSSREIATGRPRGADSARRA
jgi:N-acetylglucosaminyl-diphospho-decaprenol L-rhamnosyltransferase